MRIERTKNATKNIIFGVILKLYQILVPFFIRTAMIYSLGIEYLGLNSLFTSILQVLNLAELGVGGPETTGCGTVGNTIMWMSHTDYIETI